MSQEKYQEIEIKYKLKNNDAVLEEIKHLNAHKIIEDEYQCDTYLVPAHRNFFQEDIVSEWLRLRMTNTKGQINYKRWLPIGAKIQTHCEEYESSVSDMHAIKKILEYLDFKEMIKVEKKRNCWKYDDILICIDEVVELGSYIELEYSKPVEEDEIDEIANYMEKVLHDTLHAKVEPRDRRGYPFHMMKLKGILMD